MHEIWQRLVSEHPNIAATILLILLGIAFWLLIIYDLPGRIIDKIEKLATKDKDDFDDYSGGKFPPYNPFD